jgi:hypothetical protein
MGAGCSKQSAEGPAAPQPRATSQFTPVENVDQQFRAARSKVLALLRSSPSLQQAAPPKALTVDQLWDDVSGE